MRALISVYDKSGITELATGLAELGWDLVSSGGTARQLREAAMREPDPELREKLWDEYRNYTGLGSND